MRYAWQPPVSHGSGESTATRQRPGTRTARATKWWYLIVVQAQWYRTLWLLIFKYTFCRLYGVLRLWTEINGTASCFSAKKVAA